MDCCEADVEKSCCDPIAKEDGADAHDERSHDEDDDAVVALARRRWCSCLERGADTAVDARRTGWRASQGSVGRTARPLHYHHDAEDGPTRCCSDHFVDGLAMRPSWQTRM